MMWLGGGVACGASWVGSLRCGCVSGSNQSGERDKTPPTPNIFCLWSSQTTHPGVHLTLTPLDTILEVTWVHGSWVGSHCM